MKGGMRFERDGGWEDGTGYCEYVLLVSCVVVLSPVPPRVFQRHSHGRAKSCTQKGKAAR